MQSTFAVVCAHVTSTCMWCVHTSPRLACDYVPSGSLAAMGLRCKQQLPLFVQRHHNPRHAGQQQQLHHHTTTTHTPSHPHRYLERQGQVEEARAAFHKLTSELAPRNVEVLVAAASFERRQGSKEVGGRGGCTCGLWLWLWLCHHLLCAGVFQCMLCAGVFHHLLCAGVLQCMLIVTAVARALLCPMATLNAGCTARKASPAPMQGVGASASVAEESVAAGQVQRLQPALAA